MRIRRSNSIATCAYGVFAVCLLLLYALARFSVGIHYSNPVLPNNLNGETLSEVKTIYELKPYDPVVSQILTTSDFKSLARKPDNGIADIKTLYHVSSPELMHLYSHPQGNFYRITHIPKCAGHSLKDDLIDQITKDRKRIRFAERCYYKWFDPTDNNVIFLRDPRKQVYSQYLECKHDQRWGRKLTKRFKDFPYVNETKAGDIAGFGKWVDYFLAWEMGDSDFGCYNPWNMQARYLTCNEGDPKQKYVHTGHGVKTYAMKIPNITLAFQNLHNYWFLGIVDYYEPSMCILVYTATESMPEKCDCRRKQKNLNTDPRFPSIFGHFWHHDVPIHDVKKDVPASTIYKMDMLIQKDLKLYELAVTLFLQKAKDLEERLGMKLIC
mmetsp:Transcript_5324/g.6268  ORF Transcript_5324/g.6268 Transcript_5324/m.6268 type:complete len:382 (+) Transcript_5324:208-1353(+)|eukprot:CAMPEP_0204862526 /NCGR_PEP_ID=MMETSP1348-20121228/2587_1 /ASSEMBLY_ACC=CAM_ASM_000700 /TAXON_ID=215587 /ORGANISM="Aplanochytrium stocchinoi, Strain GSBS06" /LENGTH=381 /DNA_ID=CAMNT_0052012507 /DNA_START=81 /DNA_END=1226 /DNA_ORIENTATION=-